MSEEKILPAYSFVVAKGVSGKKLLSFLKEELGTRFSAKALKKAIESGACRINGRVVTYAAHILRNKEKIEFFQKSLPKSHSWDAPILYEDDFLLIVNKPIGVSCDKEFTEKTLSSEYKKCLLIHRLDKNTSGVLLLAKDEKTKEAFTHLFKTQEIHKEYLAIVDGRMAQEKGVIETLIALKKQQGGRKILTSNAFQGKESMTQWRLLAEAATCSLLLCQPITGRTHQIRVHLSSVGHPLIGDAEYGGKRPFCKYFSPRPLLHAYTISFVHPSTQRQMNIKASLPKDFQKALLDLSLDKL